MARTTRTRARAGKHAQLRTHMWSTRHALAQALLKRTTRLRHLQHCSTQPCSHARTSFARKDNDATSQGHRLRSRRKHTQSSARRPIYVTMQRLTDCQPNRPSTQPRQITPNAYTPSMHHLLRQKPSEVSRAKKAPQKEHPHRKSAALRTPCKALVQLVRRSLCAHPACKQPPVAPPPSLLPQPCYGPADQLDARVTRVTRVTRLAAACCLGLTWRNTGWACRGDKQVAR